MEEMITGYQWGDSGAFIGAYSFPNNKDKVAVHMPPRTTMIQPPIAPAGKEAAYNEQAGEWYLRDVERNVINAMPRIDYLDYSETPGIIMLAPADPLLIGG